MKVELGQTSLAFRCSSVSFVCLSESSSLRCETVVSTKKSIEFRIHLKMVSAILTHSHVLI